MSQRSNKRSVHVDENCLKVFKVFYTTTSNGAPPSVPLPPPPPVMTLSSYSVSSLLHQVIVDWFNSIRAVQLHYLKVAFPGATDAEVMTATMTIVFLCVCLCVCVKCVFYLCVCFQLVPKLTRNFLKEGYMEKTGPRVSTTHNTHTHSTVNDV